MLSNSNRRPLSHGISITKGPFGRPTLVHEDRPATSQSSSVIERLRALNWARMEVRRDTPSAMDYFILIPTLRCNLRCDYCQVSRVAETARGFDWNDTLLEQTVAFIAENAGPTPTLEFQGGEPLLRLDAIIELRDRIVASGRRPKVVICTNLQDVSAAAWDFLAEPDILVSSSFDGTWETHDYHRTRGADALSEFRSNLLRAMEVLGPNKVSLTSTIDPTKAPAPEVIFREMRELGVATMFVRPVNFQGFARKAFSGSRQDDAWDHYYLAFLDALVQHNLSEEAALSEYYFSYILRRILDPRRQEHVDLRNPNPLGVDYVVIGEKGDIFPTDEARMLFRTGQIDLRIGHVSAGINSDIVEQLNQFSDNREDPDCAACVYQAVCGRDLVDDLSRYGRIDTPRLETRHCQRHLAIFDHVMSKLAFAPQAEIEVMARMAGLSGIDLAHYR